VTTAPRRPRVLLADDHLLVAEALRSLLTPEFDLVEVVEDGRQLIEAAGRLHPDVIVADITMPHLNGIDALVQLRQGGNRVPVVFLTMHRDATFARRALEAGASGFVLKHSASVELIAALHAALEGKTYLTPQLAGDVLEAMKQGPERAADPISALTLVAIALFRSLQMRAFGSIQLASTLAQVTQRGRQILDGVYPDKPLPEAGSAHGPRPLPHGARDVIWTAGPGILQAIDVPRIISAARDADAVVEIVVPFGETVQQHAPVAVVHGTADPSLDAEVLKSIRTGVERTFEQDPALALRVLVDIALREVSSAINDPTTAVQVLDSEESLLRVLIRRDLNVREATGPHGSARVLLSLPDWDDYLALSFDEVIEMGADHVQVRRRLERLLRDLIALAPASRRAPLQRRLDGLASGRSPVELDAPPAI